MDVVTLFFAVIISLLLTKYLPPHSTYLETLRELKDEIQNILSRISDFGSSLEKLKTDIASEVHKATEEIAKLKDQDSGEIKGELQKTAAKIESIDGIIQGIKSEIIGEIGKVSQAISTISGQKDNSSDQELKKVVEKLSDLDSVLKSLKEEVTNQALKMTQELSKLDISKDQAGSEELKSLMSKVADIQASVESITKDVTGQVQKISDELNQLKAQSEVLTAFIEEAKKSRLPEQFDLYNGLWISLVELKTIVSELWQYPSREKAKKLAKQVLETRKILEQSAIFVPESLFNKLMGIMDEFESMQFGKISLVKLRNVSVKNKDFPENELKSGLKASEKIKDGYISALEELKKFIRENVVESK